MAMSSVAPGSLEPGEETVSAEHLDRLLQVTQPRGWLALLGVALLILAALGWGVFGSVPTLVRSRGVLIRTGGVFEVVAQNAGQLERLAVNVEDMVQRGEVIGWIAQPELKEAIKNAAADLAEADQEHRTLKQFSERELALNREHTAALRLQLEHALEFAEERLRWLEERVADQKTLAAQGLITKQRLLDTRGEINATREQIENQRSRLKALAIEAMQFEEQRLRRLQQSEQDLSLKQRELDRIQAEYKDRSRILSPYTGRVLEVGVDEGRRVEAGEAIVRMELSGEGIKKLEAVLFVAPESGKKVEPGMAVHIAPSTVKEEEYGFMLGRITYVAAFPASEQAMMRVLQNKELVAALSAGSTPIQVYADILPDPDTVSGFRWSSKAGPPLKVYSGTLCRATITVSEEAPIRLLLPTVKKTLFGIRSES